MKMSNSLLKTSSSWFLRPPHFEQQQVIRKKPSVAPVHTPRRILLPEEEYSIRNLCPVTLNHLLPDLHLTRKEFLADALVEFDANLRVKFEKHLEDSHTTLSGSSSDSEDDSEPEQEDIEQFIENDLSSVELKNRNSAPKMKILEPKMKILHPNKVNYPLDNMKLLLPDIKLNNKRSCSPILTKSFCTGCINRGMCLDKEFNRNRLQNYQGKKVYGKNTENGKFLPKTISNKIYENEMKYNFRKNILCDIQTDSIDFYREETKYLENSQGMNFENESSTLYRPPDYRTNNFAKSWPNSTNHKPTWPNSRHRCQASLPVPSKRSRSVSPSKDRDLWPDPESHCPPSPYVMELVRLRRERLRIEERMLLRRRQVQELERLRPPVDRWYEMKDCRFHREAHKNNMYVKNEKILPLIENRRRLICDTIRF